MSALVPQPVDDRERLRQTIAADEERLRQALKDLSNVVRRRTDVGRWARHKPYRWLGSAFTVGLILGLTRKERSWS